VTTVGSVGLGYATPAATTKDLLTTPTEVVITHTHGPLSGTTQVSRYQKGKPIWILLEQEAVSGVAVSSAGPYASLHLAADRQPCQHPTTQLFTGRMPFLPPNQQRQSTEVVITVARFAQLHGDDFSGATADRVI